MKTQQAEELLQDTFFGLFRWLKKYWEEHGEPPSAESIEKVLHKIEINRYINYYHKYIKPAEDGTGSARPENGHPSRYNPVEPLTPSGQSPDQRMLREELLARVAECMEKDLEPLQKQALLYKARGYSLKDIAALIDQDEGTVAHSTIPLARKKLKRCIGDYVYGNQRR